MHRTNDILGVVLVGGKSTRFGQSKARLVLPNQKICVVETLLARLSDLNLPVAVVTNSSDRFFDLGVASWCDMIPSCGPLGGLYTALTKAQGKKVLALTCDMPLVSTDLLKKLLVSHDHGDDACVFTGRHGLEPFPGVYSPVILENLQRRLVLGKHSMRHFLDSLMQLKHLPAPHTLKEFFNMNTREDFRELMSYKVIQLLPST